MKSLEDILRAELGLADDAVLEPVVEIPLGDHPTGYGHATAARLDLETVARDPMFEALEIPPANTNATPLLLPFEFGKDVSDPHVVSIRFEHGTARAIRGHVRTSAQEVILLGGQTPASAIVTVDVGAFAVEVHAGVLRIVSIHDDEAPWDVLGESPDTFAWLREIDVDAILSGWHCPDWLRETAKALAASENLVDRAASLGLIGRLWEPDGATERGELTGRPGDDPNARLLHISGSLSVDAVRCLEERACTQATSLLEELGEIEALGKLGKGGDEDWLLATRELAYHRDDLESVFFVLLQCHAGQALSKAVGRADDAISSCWSSLPTAGSFAQDGRLAQVAALEPDAWWGFWSGSSVGE
jgi:hypothetical protein